MIAARSLCLKVLERAGCWQTTIFKPTASISQEMDPCASRIPAESIQFKQMIRAQRLRNPTMSPLLRSWPGIRSSTLNAAISISPSETSSVLAPQVSHTRYLPHHCRLPPVQRQLPQFQQMQLMGRIITVLATITLFSGTIAILLSSSSESLSPTLSF